MQRISIGIAKDQGNTVAIPLLYICNYVYYWWFYTWKDFGQPVGSQEKAMRRCKATVGMQYTSL